ncbi:MAG: Y-family DNA polymerase [Pseudomonadota bacterium]
MDNKIYALVDANNFYATCEKIFQPELEDLPVVVLSNNDGCIVARSAEAKQLKIPMGAPIHEWRDFCAEHEVVIKSSNYTLYGDMSARMLSVLQDMCPLVESYSIDESFLDLAGFSSLSAMGYDIRASIRRRTHITCGVGIGPTKTLAKFANLIAKKQPFWGGVFNLLDHPIEMTDSLMSGFSVTEVWGVGPRLGKRLAADGISSVLDLKRAAPGQIRQRYGIVLEKTVRELGGQSCLSMEEVGRPKQQIMASRSFGTVLTDFKPIRAAVTHHLSRAAEKLRQQNGLAQHVYVMVRTNPFREQDLQYRRTTLVPLTVPTADTSILLAAAMAGLREVFQSGLKYHKVGVMLGEISDAGEQQPDLFASADDPKRTRLMSLMDEINQKQGKGTLRFASTDLDSSWHMRTANRSPRYTTCWDELPIAYA